MDWRRGSPSDHSNVTIPPLAVPDHPSKDAVELVIRTEYARILATLIRVLGDLGLAEDAVQDATVRALERWPNDGVPSEPRAWLITVARRSAIDSIRRESVRGGKEAQAMALLDDDAPIPDDVVVRDDLLRLVFTCCHPALSLDAQVALSLRTLGGLTTVEVARALLVPEATMAKRLTRAKQKIAQAHIPYRVPSAAELPDRLAGVLATVYQMFNEGYASGSHDMVVRQQLVDESIRLGRLLHALMPDEASVTGLLALMVLQDSRRATRIDADGAIVLLADQDRTQWDHDEIREGVAWVGQALRRAGDHPHPYVVQAAIAACHALADDYAATDWDALISWYDVLLGVDDSPVAQLGRASAVAERDGAAAGLDAVEAIGGLEGYPWWHAARAELLIRLERFDEARQAVDEAAVLGLPLATVKHLRARTPSR